jgi:hypothetical protein
MVPQQLTSAKPSHASITGELADLLIELSSALQKFCIYSSGHPALLAAAGTVAQRLARRRGHRGTLCLAVAADRVIVEVRPKFELTRRFEGVSSKLSHPLLHSFAVRLREHELDEIALAEGVTVDEISKLLSILGTEPAETGRPLGAEPDEVLHDLPHVRIRRRGSLPTGLTVGAGGTERSDERDDELWAEFARDALGIEEGAEARAYDPGEIARAIDVRSGSETFDRRMIGYLLQIADNLGEAGVREAIDLRRNISAVLRQLDKVTLQCLMNMTGDGRLRRKLLSDFACSLDVDVVLDLVQAAAEDENCDVSRGMIRLLSKLARHASHEESPVVAYRGDEGLRRVVQRLISGWQLENPNDEDYDQLLASLSMSVQTGGAVAAAESEVDPERVVQLCLETDVASSSLGRCIDDLLAAGHATVLIDLLDQVPVEGDVATSIWSRLTGDSVLRRLIEEEEPDFAVIDRILPHAGLDASGPLLDRLAAAESRTVRRHVFDRLRLTGSAVGPMAVQRIGSSEKTPWFVLRNMLSLLVVLDELPGEFDPRVYAKHENPQVRQEALRLCMRMPKIRDAAILSALADPLPRIVAMGVYEAEMGAHPSAASALAKIALSAEEDADLRAHAARALARLATPEALEHLLSLARPRRRGLRTGLPPESPVVLAVIRGLAEHWASEPRAEAILERARKSDNRSIAKAAS